MKIKVFKDHMGDWTMECWEHVDRLITCNWSDAYEAAVGHACMHHTKVRVCACGTRYAVSVGCWWCR